MRVKSLIFSIAILLSVYSSYAQKKPKQPKPSLGKMEALITKSKAGAVTLEELTKGKEMADLAVNYDKTKGKSKTWYLRGSIYKLIYENEQEVSGVSKEEALKTATAGFNKAKEIGGESDTYSFSANNELEALWGDLVNKGVTNYNDGDNKEAAKYFEYVALVKPQDTTGHLYAAAAAQEDGDFPRAIKNYKNLTKVNPKEKYWTVIIALQKQELKDFDAALATIEEAKKSLGEDNTEINKYEIDILIATNKVQAAIDKLNTAIANEPTNSKLLVRQGLLYDQLVNDEKKKDKPDETKITEYQDKAEEAYKAALKIDDKDLTANFNYAVVLSNKANVYFKEYNLMTPAEERKRGKEVKDKGQAIVKSAIPYMEKALEIQPDDQDILYALQSFYNKVNNKDKMKEISDKLNELGYDN